MGDSELPRASIARNVKRRRALLGWSQAKLAEELGVDVMQVSRWERAAARPDEENELRLADVLFGGDLAALYAAEAA